MKFMRTAETSKKNKLKEQAKMLVDQIEESGHSDAESEEEKPKAGGLFNSSAKFTDSKKVAIDTDKVLQTAKEMFQKHQAAPAQEAGSDDGSSESETDSKEDMSFTSEENNNDAMQLLALVAD